VRTWRRHAIVVTTTDALAAAPRLAGGIPKIIHRVWFGTDLPPDAIDFGIDWERLHPKWTVVCWREWTLPALRNQAAVDRSESPAQRADVVRFELLRRWGGVYVDTDLEPLRPLDDLLGDVGCAVAREDEQWIGTAFVAATPGHPFVERISDRVGRRVSDADGSIPPNVLTGPQFVTAELRRWLDEGGDAVAVFPSELFYPYHFSEPHRRDETFPDAYAAHHWAGSWT
jgi:mannosyltransferase OCH1-like enzyme